MYHSYKSKSQNCKDAKSFQIDLLFKGISIKISIVLCVCVQICKATYSKDLE